MRLYDLRPPGEQQFVCTMHTDNRNQHTSPIEAGEMNNTAFSLRQNGSKSLLQFVWLKSRHVLNNTGYLKNKQKVDIIQSVTGIIAY
jgi:hypothetical protein